MATAIIEHTVADFDTWLQHYTDHAPARIAAGLPGATVHQAMDNPNHVYIIYKDVDLDAFRAFGADPALREVMRKAGVQGEPTLHVIGAGSVHDG